MATRMLRVGTAAALVEGPQLREVLSSCARWIREEPVHPPSSVATALAKRGHWRYPRDLRAVTSFPVLSERGELRTEPSYNEATRTFCHATCDVSVPEHPTRTDAERACNVLLDLVSDFPFASKEHESAWLASVLVPLSRFMHEGNVPLTIIQANAAGSGKTTLAQIIALITMGNTVPVMSCEKGEPNRKEIISKLRASPPVAIVDDILGRFGGTNMNALITSRSFEDRALGHLKTLSAPNDTAWFATGNRVLLAPDREPRVVELGHWHQARFEYWPERTLWVYRYEAREPLKLPFFDPEGLTDAAVAQIVRRCVPFS